MRGILRVGGFRSGVAPADWPDLAGQRNTEHRPRREPERALRVADDVLHGLGHALFARAWARIGRAAVAHTADPWYSERQHVARFGLQWLLPQSQVHWDRVDNGGMERPWLDA